MLEMFRKAPNAQGQRKAWWVAVAVLAMLGGLAAPAGAAGTYDPRGVWNALFVCKTGWCKGQQFKRVVNINAWDPASGAFSGTLTSGTFTGTISGSTITASSTDAGINETFSLSISSDGLTWSGTGTGRSGATGAETMTRTVAPVSTAAASPTTAAGTVAPSEPTSATTNGTTTTSIGIITSGTDASFAAGETSAPAGETTAASPSTPGLPGPTTVSRPTTRPQSSAGGAAVTTVSSSTTRPPVAAIARSASGGSPSHPARAVQSTFLGLPNPSQALTLKNVVLAGVLSILLMLIVIFPSTLFNNTLEANIDVIRDSMPRWLRVRTDAASVRTDPASVTPDPDKHGSDGRSGSGADQHFWQSWRGFTVYMMIAGVLYSFMQPGWGFNTATAHTLLGFLTGIAVSTMTGIVMTRSYLRRYGNVSGHMEVEAATLVFAVVCVVASRLANFVPGYFYGVIAMYIPTHKPNIHDDRNMKVRTVVLTYVLAIVGWLSFTPLQHVAADGGFFGQLPLSLAGGLVPGAVQSIVIGLIPLRFLPGHTLKQWNPRIWGVSYLGGAFLFSLVLLRPGLVGAHETSIAWTVAIAVFFAVGSIAFWWYFRQRESQPETGLRA